MSMVCNLYFDKKEEDAKIAKYKVYWIIDIKMIDYFLKGNAFLCIESNVVLHCIS